MRRWRAPVAVAAATLIGLLASGPALAADGAVAPASVGADGRVSVAVVAPITVPVGTPGLLTSAQLARYTAPGGVLTQELSSVLSTTQPVTLAIDPRIIASIRVLGSAAPDSATAWLQRLADAPNETFPLLYADADPVLAGQAGLGLDLSPLSFDFALDPDAFSSPLPTASPSPTATASTGDEPPLPQTPAQVLAWDWTYPEMVWPSADTVSDADLPRLSATGYTTVLLSDGNVTGPAGHVRLTNEGAPQDLTGIVADTDLSVAASAVADSDSPGAETALAGLAAATQSAAADARGAVRVVTLQRSASSSLRFLPAALGAMEGAGATPVPLRNVMNQDPADATLVDRAEPEDRLAGIPAIVSAVGADEAFSSVAVEPIAITGPRRLDLLAIMSTGWVGDDAWSAAVQKFLSASTRLRDGVSLVPTSPARALGANVPLPVTVRNELDTAIRVYAIVRPLRPALSIPADKRRVEITVQPDSTQITRIPTQSVSNGTVDVRISLVTASGVAVDDPTTLKVDVQAGWETAGTLIALVLVLGVFGFGVTRNILRRRAERRARMLGGTDASG